MQTFTLVITNDSALKVLQDLHEKHFINIISTSDFNSPVFPGKRMTRQEFGNFIQSRENGPSMTLKEAKAKWAKKKKQIAEILNRPVIYSR